MAEDEIDCIVLDVDEHRINDEKRSGEFISTKQEAHEKIKKDLERRGLTLDELIKNLKIKDEEITDIRKNSSLSLKEIGDLFGGIRESRMSRILNKKA